MAMMPGAVDRRLANQSRQGRMKGYQGIVLHTMVGSLSGTDGMFRKGGTTGTESHFGVGEKGEIYQWMDTAYSADANYRGSAYVISIETADYGGSFGRWNTSGDNVPSWNAAQIKAIVRIIQWAAKTHNIPIRQMKSVKDRGIGFHAMGVPRNGLPSGLMGTRYQWSKYAGKVCPGRRRISQVPGVVRLAAGGAATEPIVTKPTPEKGIFDMSGFESRTRNSDQRVPAGSKVRLRAHPASKGKDGDHWIARPKNYRQSFDLFANVAFDRIPDEADVKVRFAVVIYRDNGKSEVRYPFPFVPVSTTTGAAGVQLAQPDAIGFNPKGKGVKAIEYQVEVANFSKSDVNVKSVYSGALYE